MAVENFDEEFTRVFDELKALKTRIDALEHPKEIALQEITLQTTDGKFRVRVALKHCELEATPLHLNPKGEWVVGTSGPVSSRWQVNPDGSMTRFA
jgi:hypothetical protein